MKTVAEDPSSKKGENNNAQTDKPATTLSEHLHKELEVVLSPTESAKNKIHVIDRLRSFIDEDVDDFKLKENQPDSGEETAAQENASKSTDNKSNNLHSPRVADRFITFHPPPAATDDDQPDRSDAHASQRSGIQLPSLNWNAHFRKGYSLLMWIRVHSHTSPNQQQEENPDDYTIPADSSGSMDSGSSMQTQRESFEARVLYRFATSGDRSARGIQATLHAAKAQEEQDTVVEEVEEQNGEEYIHTVLRVEAIIPRIYSAHSNTSHASASSTKALVSPLKLPVNKWTLLGIQHYISMSGRLLENRKPILTVHLDGDEICRREMYLPMLGSSGSGNHGEMSEETGHNYLLCNIPDRQRPTTNYYHRNQYNQHFSRRELGISRLDLASVGLYQDIIPGYMQGIVSEHGPCLTSDGAIPIVPPVTQCRDAVVMGGDGNPKYGKKKGFLKSSVSASNGNGNGVAGRGIGVPLCKGLLLTSDGNVTGDLHLQKFLSKLVLGMNASDALCIGDQSIVMKVHAGFTVGLTGEVPKIGMCQPKLPLGHSASSAVSPFGGDVRERDGLIGASSTEVYAKCLGKMTLTHATTAFLEMEKSYGKDNGISTYQLPTAAPNCIPTPSFLLTYVSVNPMTYILQAFHMALPPPGQIFNLQTEYYRASFDHLYDLIVYKNGAFAAKLIDLVSANITVGGRMRDEILQAGAIHSLSNLLRKVLLRALRLGMLDSSGKIKVQRKDRLWQIYSSKESSIEESADSAAPSYIPPAITESCCRLIQKCCGPTLSVENKDKISQHIRRTSDLALTAVFGFAFDLDLWGGDHVAAATILRQVVDRYCCVEGKDEISLKKHDNGYGWLLRGQISVQFLLDLIRLRYNNQVHDPDNNKKKRKNTQKSKKAEAISSLASSFSSILYTMLKYSLSSSRSTFRGEQDISAAVAALSHCPLGSIGAHVVLHALNDILIYCEISNGTSSTSGMCDSIESDTSQDSALQNLVQNMHNIQSPSSPRSPPLSPSKSMTEDEEQLKLTRIKSDIAARLGKNLLMAQFHDVIAPMLLSRTVFDARRAMMESNAAKKVENDQEVAPSDNKEKDIVQDCGIGWQKHWRITLLLFTWLASIAGPDGEIAAKSTGSLLFHSGKAGSLFGCLLERGKEEKDFFSSLLIPPIPLPDESRVAHTNDLSHRFRIVMHLFGGLVSSLVYQDSNVTRKETGTDDGMIITSAAVDSLNLLISVVTTTFRYLHARGGGSLGSSNYDAARHRKFMKANPVGNKMSVKAAKEAVPPLLVAAALLNRSLYELKQACKKQNKASEESPDGMVSVNVSEPFAENSQEPAYNNFNRDRTSSDISWVDVTPSKIDFSYISCSSPTSLGEQYSALKGCQERLLSTAGILILNAMIVGGGEASTMVWRVVISAISSTPSSFIDPKNEESDVELEDDETQNTSSKSGNQVKDVAERNLLCRLVAMVFTGIISRRQGAMDNPWDSVELCSSTARLCDLVEEKELLQTPLHSEPKSESSKGSHFSSDQVHLLCALLNIMESGRNQTGWCQLSLPTRPDAMASFTGLTLTEEDTKDIQNTSLLDSSIAQEQMDEIIDHGTDLYQNNMQNSLDSSLAPIPVHDIQVNPDRRRQIFAKSLSPSKLLLPILQPTLRIVLSCLGEVRSKTNITESSKGMNKSLLSKVIEELNSTLIAAIVGLTFSNSRDVCLNALVCLRKAINLYNAKEDRTTVDALNGLLLTVVNEMRVRYADERRKRETAKFKAYDDSSLDSPVHSAPLSFLVGHEAENGEKRSEMANANEVESLLMGGALIDRSVGENSSKRMNQEESIEFTSGLRPRTAGSESDDFILFPQDENPAAGTTMGWSNYKGFGQALEKCCLNLNDGEQSNIDCNERSSNAESMLEILSSYLDKWDEKQTLDAAESELVEMFDESSSLSSSPSHNARIGPTSIVTSSETAADSMSSYIEISSSETGRLADIRHLILPSRRNGCTAFTERYCWKQFLELIDYERIYGEHYFERCMSDGGRDYTPRLVSNPTHPQFPRFVPRQLDHSSSESELVSERNPLNDETKNAGDQDIGVDMGEIKNLFEKVNLNIVDVTKKQISMEEEDIDESDNVLVSKPSMDIDGEVVNNVACDDDHNDDDDKNSTNGEMYLDFPTRPDVEEDDEEESHTTHAINEKGEHKEETSSFSMNDEGRVTDGNSYHYNFVMSSFANPPNGTNLCLRDRHKNSAGAVGYSSGGGHGFVELSYENCLQVKAEGSRKGDLFLTPTFLILEYSDPDGLLEGETLAVEEKRKRMKDELSPVTSPTSQSGSDITDQEKKFEQFEQQQKRAAALRPKSMRWNISELSHIYLRRYRLRDSALELFFLPSAGSTCGGSGLLSALSSVFLDFGAGVEGNIRRDSAANAIMKRAPAQTVKQWPEKSGQVLHEQLRSLIKSWMTGRISNFDYLLSINCLAGRSFNDLCQYPVFPWVLSNYTSEEVPDLTDKNNFRDLTKPMGALNPERLEEFIERFESFQDAMIPPFMYGSHYSTSAGVVLHFLVRMHPFASLHRQLQGGHFDVADRLFSSVARTWDMCTGVSAAEVKELTPEWYCNPNFLKNTNNFKLGTSQEGQKLDDVILPPWAKGSPEKFVEVMRSALESDVCTSMLPDWIDLIFGRKQQGPAAVEAHNVFFYLTYYGSVDVASLEDDDLRAATELQIAHFGQCPMQLFWRPHVHKLPLNSVQRRKSLSEMLRLYEMPHSQNNKALIMSEEGMDDNEMSKIQLPFQSAPLSYWVHLFAPPPGPHAPLVSVRLAGTDKCMAIDAQGIIHCFKWAWKPDITEDGNDSEVENEKDNDDIFNDKGCFVAQRELAHFRSVPRLCYWPPNTHDRQWSHHETCAVVAISKSLFASRTLLLVVSDGDGKGAICMQLVDPVKCIVKGQVLVPAIHSARVTAVHMDPMGIASGVGGVGGELVLFGSADGTATVWRFISSQFLPLRPRLRLGGHGGSKIHGVAISSALNICATVSDHRCCLFGLGNGNMVKSFGPPSDAGLPEIDETQMNVQTVFAETNSICLSAGNIVLTCKSSLRSKTGVLIREIITIHLYTVEGDHLGSKALEAWRGIPHKISPTVDGKAVMVCSGGGVSIHLVSAISPLHFIDEWQISDDDSMGGNSSVYDIDFGPSISRPVVAVAGCSSGALRLHALNGISEWSEENRKGSVSEAVGNVLAKPAQRFKSLVGSVKGTGSRVVGYGKDVTREVVTDVTKVKRMTNLLGNVFKG